MISKMTKYFWPLLLAIQLFGQVKPPQPPPSLSTADKTAIQAMEKNKQDAQQAFNAAQQNELVILREWQSSHPGWHIDNQTFAVEEDFKPTAPATVKPPAK